MRKLLIAAAALAAAAPALAQEPPPLAEALPSGDEIAAMAPAMDRMAGAMLDVDVGPIIDAANPHRPGDGPRTLRDLAGRDDPYFEDRLRATIYGAAAGMGRMMAAIAVAAPAFQRAIAGVEEEIERAVREGRRYRD